MNERIYISGVGCTPISDHWNKNIVDLATDAIHLAATESNTSEADLLVVGNMLSGIVNHQENLGVAIASESSLKFTEVMKVEAACASAIAALRVGMFSLKAGLTKTVVVVGVEKMTDVSPGDITSAVATANCFERETLLGATSVSLVAMLTQMYLQKHQLNEDSLAALSINGFENARETSWAKFRKGLDLNNWRDSSFISPPLRIVDCPAVADGAAAVVLTRAKRPQKNWIEVAAIEGASESLGVLDRLDPMSLDAAKLSSQKALASAGANLNDIDFFEPHDAFPITAALGIEAVGFVNAGNGYRVSEGGCLNTDVKTVVPIQTMGGIKGKGHPVGASGLYQVIDAVTQLRGHAGPNQVANASTGMTQSFGGIASNVYTTILRSENT